jgi:hypothetical protein
MNVKELIDELQDYGDHLEVYGGDEDYYYTISLGTEIVKGVTSLVIGLEDGVESD